MNSSNERPNTIGQAALKTAAYIVLLNAVLSGCAGSLGSNRAAVAGEASIYDEIKVTRTFADSRRVRIKKRLQHEVELYDPILSPALVSDNTASTVPAPGSRFIPPRPSQALLSERFPPASIQALDFPEDDSDSVVETYYGNDEPILGANIKIRRNPR